MVEKCNVNKKDDKINFQVIRYIRKNYSINLTGGKKEGAIFSNLTTRWRLSLNQERKSKKI